MSNHSANKSRSAGFAQSVQPTRLLTADLTGILSDTAPWRDLAAAIIEQACVDYVYSDDRWLIYDAQRFFMGQWFEELSELDPYYLLQQLAIARKARLERREKSGKLTNGHRPTFGQAVNRTPDDVEMVDGKYYKKQTLEVNRHD